MHAPNADLHQLIGDAANALDDLAAALGAGGEDRVGDDTGQEARTLQERGRQVATELRAWLGLETSG